MALWCGIDLHRNNSVVSIIDEHDKEVLSKRLPNDLSRISSVLQPYAHELRGVVVESTYNWYWLVDGLLAAGHSVHLGNTTANKQYSGLKHADDRDDAKWLAHLLRLGVLREGYIYPASERGLRDLARKRMRLVQQRTQQTLSAITQFHRTTGMEISGEALRKASRERIERAVNDRHVALGIAANLDIAACLEGQVAALEKELLSQCRLREQFRLLQTMPGVGVILAMMIMLEVGDIGRFAKVGEFASYCRCVESRRKSNGKKKGKGNVKNGNKYLSWTWAEVGVFARRNCETIRHYHQRKAQRAHPMVANRAVSHKLARAGYWMMRNNEPFDLQLAFG